MPDVWPLGPAATFVASDASPSGCLDFKPLRLLVSLAKFSNIHYINASLLRILEVPISVERSPACKIFQGIGAGAENRINITFILAPSSLKKDLA